ncbi:hypothetical protein AB840_11640 [Megasphaera cerevisiae DSM 20462]|jgi:uncharacterized protein|uniref:DUF177 domain-containing protein n=1 Tax=Megasphaera cerevisiae DSM 20462 TaxID=1122219 RepID=A0A0J6WVD0_9FIRM|nr:DUF177 domain-containing protein [Megasphaera cerevisiae]KMO85772.1 hypothetical protein AB840_11640 [Megasphaera cerevisiae DSM 20462]MCI1751000.1 DUF177 domain-containing protein [Megasphaera cerevisiae]SKA10217.1 uncharacterized protein SAMN05660900_02436 [Megasphaera cerevisiae DSM 20462]
MKLQVEEAFKEEGRKFPFSFERPAACLGDVDAFPWKSQTIAVEGLFWSDGNHMVVRGTVRTFGRYECSRCLTPVSVDREAALSEVYGTEAELPDTVLPYNGEYIDLTETIRETLILSEPMRVLCRMDCKGLCPQCGTNLNEGPCSCPTDRIDPRFAVLGDLLKPKQ